ncbi:EF-P lysine aminoacylase EpmA [Desulfogranum mediterraneum]|uniref:EF-P lysine aminoacylase EpmA n=1 Tax=Desulfogranum mediterraneum TaxID=160661 RepID=UPI0004214B44|nr:EF-P lysine aminoacylase EpmA [Desulfogranum mediterraneum]
MLSPEGLRQRCRLLQAIRSFFLGRDYLEVDTPIRLPVLIPEAHIQPFESESWYLQTSPELCMKMLLAQGCRQLFQLCHCFRKEECGRHHQTEFTMLEWYHQGWDYTSLMAECEQLFRYLAAGLSGFSGVVGSDRLSYQGRSILLAPPWQRLSVAQAFGRYAPLSLEQALAEDCFEELLVEAVEPRLGWQTPVFLCDYPLELASLARPKAENPAVAERFELYIGGLELANGFSELVEPQLQRRRFLQELESIRAQGRTAKMPEGFLESLEELGETAGIALGVDRLLMLLLGREQLKDVIPFAGDYS